MIFFNLKNDMFSKIHSARIVYPQHICDAQREYDVLWLADNCSSFLQAANVYTPNKVFFIGVSHNRRPAPIPPRLPSSVQTERSIGGHC